ncbi:hypothetical protein LCGC14_0540180 [marine sediment metagenome]|uniref:Uncharacterized protein n=1 Tax=marine sediment metagenome TaxID=412755 RepID=A0A0F9UEF3_9ZZZZ
MILISERKKIYEKLYPKTKKGSFMRYGKRDLKGKLTIKTETDFIDKKKSFVKDTSIKTGISETVIKEDLKIAKDLIPELVKELKNTSIKNSKKNLKRISKAPPIIQEEAIRTMKMMEIEGIPIKNLEQVRLKVIENREFKKQPILLKKENMILKKEKKE